EKELLQKTLYGCVKVLTELLSLVNPTAFARACRVKAIVEELAKGLELADPWQLELAVMLAHLGYVDMAPELLERAYRGETLNAADASLMESAPRTATGLLADIPRLEAVLGIVDKLAEPLPPLVDVDKQGEGRFKWAAHVIKAAERADQLSQAKSAKSVIAEILKGEHFDPRVTASFAGVKFGNDEERRVIKIKANELKTGMLLVEDARSGAGVLMAKAGQEVTPTLAVLLRRMASRSNLMEPLTVSEKVV
ncbi:MAG TPA: HD domain-containing phosphohydrolase, partial [Polyangiaceae bacterium]|nr:HD domain-containing phosphohydrolase [Polyangiaceae bacterium]